ncbi:MAG: cytochrome P450, partial [Roseibium sp.]
MGHEEFDNRLFASDMLPDPYPVYDLLRQQDPVQWNESINAWVVTSHKDASIVLKGHGYSSDRVSLARLRYPDTAQTAFDVLSRVMVQVDEPQHKKLRELVHSAFTRTAVQNYESTVIGLCHDLLTPAIERGNMEFMTEFAIPLPLLVISEIVGVPPEDREMIKQWCDAYSFLILNFYVHIEEDRLADCTAKLAEFCAYLRERVAAAEKAPQQDLISSLALAAQNDDTLTVEDVVANCILLLNAGNETTSCLLGTGMHLLMEHPDQLAILRADPSRIPNAIEEFMRVDSPVQFLGRVAAIDLDL